MPLPPRLTLSYIAFAAITSRLASLTRMYHPVPHADPHRTSTRSQDLYFHHPWFLRLFTSWVFLERANVAISEAVCGAVVMWGGGERDGKGTPVTGYRLFRSRRAIIVSILYALACLNGGLKLNRNVEWAGKAVGTAVRSRISRSLAYMTTANFRFYHFEIGNIRNAFMLSRLSCKRLLVIQRA